jgi:surface polysaccharide O-acyltransferase-like enzyme
MTSLAAQETFPIAGREAHASAKSRDIGIDTMRGVAILMVIGIHSFQQPLSAWQTAIDAALRPCVPIFLFVSGYLTALARRVPIGKRSQAAVIPYAIAFIAAYIYMALNNPAMDHRPTTAIARFVLAYVFVYYYVFVYVGCTIVLWLIFSIAPPSPRSDHPKSDQRRIALLLLVIILGLIAGSYLDPLLLRSGFTESVVEEVRMRDLPFWFTFMALGALIGEFRIRPILADIRILLLAATVTAYVIYTAVRLFGVGDAADYDSIAFFGYAALLCCIFLALDFRSPFIASLGSGSYFIYLWHIFFVMLLRDHAPLHALGPTFGPVVTYAVTATGSILALILVRELAPARVCRWLGA